MNKKNWTMPADTKWKREARLVLLNEMNRKNMDFKEFARALESVDLDVSPKALSNKMHRGTFSFMFFLQCMRALKVSTVNLPGYDKPIKSDKGTDD